MDVKLRRTGQFIWPEIQTFTRESPEPADPTPDIDYRNRDSADLGAAAEKMPIAVIEGLRGTHRASLDMLQERPQLGFARIPPRGAYDLARDNGNQPWNGILCTCLSTDT